LRAVPNMVISAPKDEIELRTLLYTALKQREYPFAIRYPRGAVVENLLGEDRDFKEIPIGSWELLKFGTSKVAILATGIAVSWALKAYELLKELHGIEPTVVNARFIKPLDREMLKKIALSHDWIFTVEENTVVGGFGSAVLEELNRKNLLERVRVVNMGLPDRFVEHGSQSLLREKLGLSPEGIAKKVVETLKGVKVS